MKRKQKIFIGIMGIIISLFIIDFISIFVFDRPLLALKGSDNYSYKGLLYNTYYCPEYSSPQIKMKSTKFKCATQITELGKVKEIIDTSKEIKDFACAEALEQFYEDETYTYYYNCMKSNYIIVKYENGYRETVKNALKNGSIKITDLDVYHIDYLKYEK